MASSPVDGSNDASISVYRYSPVDDPRVLTATGCARSFTPCFQYLSSEYILQHYKTKEGNFCSIPTNDYLFYSFKKVALSIFDRHNEVK